LTLGQRFRMAARLDVNPSIPQILLVYRNLSSICYTVGATHSKALADASLRPPSLTLMTPCLVRKVPDINYIRTAEYNFFRTGPMKPYVPSTAALFEAPSFDMDYSLFGTRTSTYILFHS
jgi:hypothetical protein